MKNVSKKEWRNFVGGYWHSMGSAQFQLMKDFGLKPEHKFLEIGCGSLRAGRFFIGYLNKGNYFGVEQHNWLVKAGIDNELSEEDKKNKPLFLIDDNFDFEVFNKKFDFVLAKSVFTHLTKNKIKQCLNNLKKVMTSDGVFYATIFIGSSKNNPLKSNDRKKFVYSIKEIEELDKDWKINILPKDMQILKYEPRSRQTMLKFTL